MSDPKLIHQVTTMQNMAGEFIVGRDRESYFLHVPGKGAMEAWRTKSPEGYEWTDTGYYGGIEQHYNHKPEDADWLAELDSCWVTGGKCWTTGSGLAFEQVEHHFDNPAYIRAVLMEWAEGLLIFGTEATDD